jgi:hypothetical protein
VDLGENNRVIEATINDEILILLTSNQDVLMIDVDTGKVQTINKLKSTNDFREGKIFELG